MSQGPGEAAFGEYVNQKVAVSLLTPPAHDRSISVELDDSNDDKREVKVSDKP